MAYRGRQLVTFVAALSSIACAAPERAARAEPAQSSEMAALRSDLADLRRQNELLQRRVEALSVKIESLSPRNPRRAEEARPAAAAAPEPAIPPDLEVVRMSPPRAQPSRTVPHRRWASPPAPAAPPPLPTEVSLIEPETGQVAALGPAHDDLGAQAEAELKAARERSGAEAAHGLEAFAARYPRHPQADNALFEAAGAYAGAGQKDAACALLARCVDEYPAGDAMPDALEQLGECRAGRGEVAAARRIFERVLSDFPQSSAAKRAGERIASLGGTRSSSASSGRQGAVP